MGIPELLVLPLIIVYMLPTCIALLRKKQSVLAIGMVNFFLGWSVIGWIATLIWALTADPPQVVYATPVNVAIPPAGDFCPACGKFSHADGRFCPQCGQPIQRERVRAGEVQLR
jgi:hypothetical protein